MELNRALVSVRESKSRLSQRKIYLACGFQPLHLHTFLGAHLAVRLPEHSTDILTGSYGDLRGNLDRALASAAEATAVVIEWSDLDPRLGLRSSGGWGPTVQDDIVATTARSCRDLLAKMTALAEAMPAAICMPTLPLQLFGHTTAQQISNAESAVQRQVAEFTEQAGLLENVRVANRGRLDEVSPLASRLDVKMEMAAGFPYMIGHTSHVAEQLANLLYPTAPMKGLITDLDDTLWSGIVGEIGVDEIGWTLAERAQIHGLYQQQLRALAEMGALLGVASKNDPDVAKTALARTDLLIGTDALFPVEVNWKPKSQSVERILNAWNIHADSVVFVDDSPMEVAEVQEAFPGMTCLRFPKENATDALAMLGRLRDLFGKPTLSDEDRLRSDSIKANALMSMARDESDSNDFVANLNGQVAFGRSKNGKNRRLLELINKTNQFNLNGVRIEDTDWMRHLSDPSSFVVSAAYQDKFGPLGIVGVAAGKKDGDQLLVTSWVMSCRAFSRKIEFHMADYLLRNVGAGTLALAFEQTERNQPLQEFLDELNGVADEHGIVRLTSEHLAGACAELPHEVVEIRDE